MAYIRSVGLAPSRALDLDDGSLARYHVEGDKPGALNGWAVLHTHPDVWGLVGSWRTGARHVWRELVRTKMTVAERAEHQRQMKAASEARRAEQYKVHAAASEKAQHLWQVARPATDAHPYLQRKGVHAYGLKLLGTRLVVPVRDAQGTLWSLQFIDADGTKKMLTGGRVAGCYYAIGRPAGQVLVCEGVATAATLFEATGHATAAAFSCLNLARVALALRGKFPEARIVICGDDDAHTPGNPGRTAAIAAARAVGGLVALPSFEGVDR
jgi:putative DNA primase/helicase